MSKEIIKHLTAKEKEKIVEDHGFNWEREESRLFNLFRTNVNLAQKFSMSYMDSWTISDIGEFIILLDNVDTDAVAKAITMQLRKAKKTLTKKKYDELRKFASKYKRFIKNHAK